MDWYLRPTKLRFDIVYYISYYMTLNTLFATVLPIGALLFFSLSTIGGLHSIRKLVRTSIPMRMSSRMHRSSAANIKRVQLQVSIEMDPLTSNSEVGGNNHVSSKPSRSRSNSSSASALNAAAIMNAAKEARNTITEPSPQEKRLTRISIVLIIIYILCHMWKLPPTIYEIWYSITHNTTTHVHWPDWLDIVHDISHVLILANSAFNFIIYLVL